VQPTADGIEIRKLWRDFPHTREAMQERARSSLANRSTSAASSPPTGGSGRSRSSMDRSSTDPPEKIRLDPDGGDALDNLYPQATVDKIEEILARPDYAGLRF
jgi:hypothetical protein